MSKITVTYFIRPTLKGFKAKSSLAEASAHAGLTGWGKTEDDAIRSLNKKWNKLAGKSYRMAAKKFANNPSVNVGIVRMVAAD